MAASATLFALMNFFARLASSTASWASVGAVRAIVGAGVAYAVGRSRGADLRVHDVRALFWRSAFGTVSMVCTFHALSSHALSLGDTVTLLNLSPLFLAVLAPHVLGERTSPATAMSLLVAVAGVLLVLRPAIFFGPHETPTSLVGPSPAATATSAVTAALFAAIAMTMLRRVGQKDSAESIALHFSLFAFVVLGAITASAPHLPSARDAGFMVAAGLAAGFAQLAMTRAYALERAAKVGSLSYLAVVASAVLGAVVLGERPRAIALVGMVLVVTSGLLVTFATDDAHA
jgi:drug/metabolite transporter (DMT)-like permease